ncbi:MAG: hypothetical protein KDC98_09165 [Planctomycetes bacterium]|nr:hypothetical protein [Planctomycetota bacterium]
MKPVKVKKIVAVCFVEAAKTALDHLGSQRLELDGSGDSSRAELSRHYGECRRLRDYLQSCLGRSSEWVELDLSDDDAAMLVASCRRYVEVIDARLRQMQPGRDRTFLERKQKVISDWTVELARKPLLDFALPRVEERPGDGARDLKRRLQEKLFAISEQAIIQGGMFAPIGSSAMTSAPKPATGDAATDPLTAGEASGLPTGMEDTSLAESPLLECSALREPRLRALVGMDLRSLAIAEENADYRVATVMLTSILEAAVLDYAIPRRAVLGLEGTPDSWCPQEILLQVLGDAASPEDRAFAYGLFFARNMLKPAYQIVSPTVATAASVQRTREFVGDMLYHLGVRRTAGSGRRRRAKA